MTLAAQHFRHNSKDIPAWFGHAHVARLYSPYITRGGSTKDITPPLSKQTWAQFSFAACGINALHTQTHTARRANQMYTCHAYMENYFLTTFEKNHTMQHTHTHTLTHTHTHTCGRGPAWSMCQTEKGPRQISQKCACFILHAFSVADALDLVLREKEREKERRRERQTEREREREREREIRPGLFGQPQKQLVTFRHNEHHTKSAHDHHNEPLLWQRTWEPSCLSLLTKAQHCVYLWAYHSLSIQSALKKSLNTSTNQIHCVLWTYYQNIVSFLFTESSWRSHDRPWRVMQHY